jgi:hypothetical protein
MTDPQFEYFCCQYPLSARWERPSFVRHDLNIGDVILHLAGLSAVDATGQAAYGSAGQLVGSPVARAYFELIERTSILEAMARTDGLFEVRDAVARLTGIVATSDLFPASSNALRWRFARSNGVAVAADWQQATGRATLELIERDRVLRSWYGDGAPHEIKLDSALALGALCEHYEFHAYSFPGSGHRHSAVTVAGFFGFPRRETAPFVFGLGARNSCHEALTAAAGECLQRLGFLWGEAILGVLPPFSPTPDFHQDYYLHPPHQKEIREWLAGAHREYDGILTNTTPAREVQYFVDLTPEALRSQLVVVKALPVDELPLVFGHGHPNLRRPPPERLAIHPIA